MAKNTNTHSSGNIVNLCCFWSVVVSGIAILVSLILGWCEVGGQAISIINRISHAIMMIGLLIGGFYYLTGLHGKNKWIWIVLYIIGVVVGILGISLGRF